MTHIGTTLFGVLAAVLSVRADESKGTTNVTCSADYDWAKNSFNQSPCLVAAILVAAPTCYDDAYNIPPLPGTQYYSNAGWQIACVCNDVVYSLFSACADCQGHTFVNYTSWTGGCNATFHGYQGTVPPSTTIPGWADLNIEEEGIYDPEAAKDFAQSLASASSAISRSAASSASVASVSLASVASVASLSAAEHSTTLSSSAAATSNIAPKTGTSSISGLYSASAGADHASSPTPSSSSGSGGKKSDAGAIAGGVVGGVVVLGLLLALGAFCLRRKSTSRGPAAAASPDVPAPSTHMARVDTPFTTTGSAPYTNVSSPPPTQRLYDPADPSTFPPPAAGSAYSHGQTASYAADPFQSPVSSPSMPASMYTQATRPYNAAGHAGYTGAPEV